MFKSYITLPSLLAATALGVVTGPLAAAGGFVDLVEDVSPAVVFVKVTGKAQAASGQSGALPADPRFEEFMKRFGFPSGPGQNHRPEGEGRKVQGLGSGFLISEDGLIVTNHHVIDGASSVTVTLADGAEVDATIVGSDPLTDIALLDIEGEAHAAVSFGSSEDLKVGEEVIAVGSPFGLGGTVTSGIISAKSRNINSGPFDDFLQTDAAINRGNSGGPLFNMDGEVVGVNTAIYSAGGGSVGIGFSVPSDLVKTIVADLKDDGEITRSWLGVQIKPLTNEVAHVLGMTEGQGVMIEEVLEDSPAQKAGLQKGDVILNFDGTQIKELRDLTASVASTAPGTESSIELFRGGREVSKEVTLEKRAAKEA